MTDNSRENTFQRDVKIFYSLIDKLHFEDIVQCLLVLNDIRPSYMIQVIDRHRIDRDIDSDLSTIHEYFGFHTKQINQGIIVSKNKIPKDINNYSSQELGDYLGYVCSADFVYHTNPEKFEEKYRLYSVVVSLSYDNITAPLFANICREMNLKRIEEYSETINRYITELNRVLTDDATKKIHYMISINIIYKIEDIIKMYIDYHQSEKKDRRMSREKKREKHTEKSKERDCRKFRDEKSLRDNLWEILSNFGYYLLVLLDYNRKLDLLDPRYYDDILKILKDSQDEFYGHSKYQNLAIMDKIKRALEIANRYGIQVSDSEIEETKREYLLHECLGDSC